MEDPTNNALLMNFLLSSDAEIFVNKHRLSMQICTKRAKMCMQCVFIATELSFCIASLVVGEEEEEERDANRRMEEGEGGGFSEDVGEKGGGFAVVVLFLGEDEESSRPDQRFPTHFKTSPRAPAS